MPANRVKRGKRHVTDADYETANVGGHMDGHLKDMPHPLAWYWPKGKLLRHLTCKVYSWVGTSAIGATHYYASVDEERNHVWDGEKWTQSWPPEISYEPGSDWPEFKERGEGRKFDKGFLTEKAAENYINRILKKHFSPETHTIEWDRRNQETAKYLKYRIKDGD
jgi:hypothetical protein